MTDDKWVHIKLIVIVCACLLATISCQALTVFEGLRRQELIMLNNKYAAEQAQALWEIEKLKQQRTSSEKKGD